MKTKVLLSICTVAITAFSFTFASTTHEKYGARDSKKQVKTGNKREKASSNAPIGGFVMEYKIAL